MTLECKLSKPNKPVIWTKDSNIHPVVKEIVPSEDCELVVDGPWHRLILRNVPLDAEGEYTCKCGDEETKAMLWVEGR